MSLKLMKQSSVNIEIYNGIGQLVKLTTNQIYDLDCKSLTWKQLNYQLAFILLKRLLMIKNISKKIIKNYNMESYQKKFYVKGN